MKTALHNRIEELPEALRRALEQEARAKAAAAHLNLKREREQQKIKARKEEEPDQESFEYEITALKERTKLEKLGVKRSEVLAKVETEVRAQAKREGNKVTESTVQAMVESDSRIVKIKEDYLDAQETLKIKEIEGRHKALLTAFERRQAESLSDEEQETSSVYTRLYALEEQLVDAEEKLDLASAEVEVQRAVLTVYSMLVKLETETSLHT